MQQEYVLVQPIMCYRADGLCLVQVTPLSTALVVAGIAAFPIPRGLPSRGDVMTIAAPILCHTFNNPSTTLKSGSVITDTMDDHIP